jgi:hypothetical protein
MGLVPGNDDIRHSRVLGVNKGGDADAEPTGTYSRRVREIFTRFSLAWNLK